MPRPAEMFIFPHTVREIEDGIFGDKMLLRSVTLNEGLEKLGGLEDYKQYSGAFCGAQIMQVTLPQTLRILGDCTFHDC